ncbi:MAG: methyltransferase, FxLD system [Chloroflexia bacterium]|nr:methyltransferase, FxLD system [Chloroflexia bacterium]
MATELDVRERLDALVDALRARGEIRSAAVEAAFRAVPRHVFLPEAPLDRVYADEAIPTRYRDGVPISSSSQPAAMAIMLEQLDVRPGQRVLEIGAGTGYNAALLAYLAGPDGTVVTIDLDAEITAEAAAHLAATGYERVVLLTRDGAEGAPEYAPFDRIILTVGAWDIAPAWIDQLAPGGRLLVPLWLRGAQRTVAFERADGHLASVSVSSCAFMRLRGDFAGPEGFLSLATNGDDSMALAVEDRAAHDPVAVARWLDQPGPATQVGESFEGQSLWKGILFWLALREDDLCQLSADAEKSAHPLVPRLFGISATYRWTLGLLGERGLALVLRAEPERAAGENGDRPADLVVQAFGDDPAPAIRLAAAMRAWLAERDGEREPRLRVYPKGTAPPGNGVATLIPKRQTDIVVDWPPAGSDLSPRV